MNALFLLTAQTLLEHCRGRSTEDVTSACDAAVEFLVRQGCSPLALRGFLRLLRREAHAFDRTISAVLSTPSGDSGPGRGSIGTALEHSLSRTVELQEQADPSLLGGAVLRAGDERLDASIRGALQRLYSSLSPSL